MSNFNLRVSRFSASLRSALAAAQYYVINCLHLKSKKPNTFFRVTALSSSGTQ